MRIRIYAAILLVFLTILVTGLFYTQIIMYERYKTMSEENRLKIVPLMAPRGTIFDMRGHPMVKDVLSFDLSVVYGSIKDKERLVSILSKALDVPRDEMDKAIKKSRFRPYAPYVVYQDIGIEKAIHIEESMSDLPGVILDVSASRRYLYGACAGNLIGYIGLLNKPEFERLKPYGYRIDDLVGRAGVEQYYDEYLRGKHGGKQVEVDHKGRESATLGYLEPVPGKDLYLTIDLELQQYCELLMEGKRGAIVALDPNTGAVRAMVSSPGYDPGIFVDRSRRNEIRPLMKDKEYPMINRAVAGAYPPGSVFKSVVAVAALESGKIKLNTTFNCDGSMRMGKRVFHCWKETGHGPQVIQDALKNSCNVFFWNTGLTLGVDILAEYAGRFGVGQRTGIDLPGEVEGLLPSKEWKQKNMKEQWYKGETMNYSVGQGYLLCTPIQVARMMSVFANGGYMIKPYIVEKIEDMDVNTPEKIRLGISERTLSAVREGLNRVVNDRRGTGIKARQESFEVAGKTGTSQTGKKKNHGWFAGFAPFDHAALTVVVFDEYGGRGGYYAAETAGKVFSKAHELGIL
ncbi:MAG: penicillin-binding protein 2 [Candidatus Omnitrophica bacterium]|nr:penicillin-binding protein 2 [Candidatus Omnitrophota bacterium]MDD5488371.1 penicillin-binding protein 2 [Candidatus Omnitrophota bacterium]